MQSKLGIERMCQLAGVSRAGFYRSLEDLDKKAFDNGDLGPGRGVLHDGLRKRLPEPSLPKCPQDVGLRARANRVPEPAQRPAAGFWQGQAGVIPA